MAGTIVERARRGSGLSQRELARRAGTSQPTLSTYEHGTKSPALAVVERIVNSSGFDLDLSPRSPSPPIPALEARRSSCLIDCGVSTPSTP